MPVRPDMIVKSARQYEVEMSNDASSFGIGASPVKSRRPGPPELEHPGCVGCMGCGSSQAKKIS